MSGKKLSEKGPGDDVCRSIAALHICHRLQLNGTCRKSADAMMGWVLKQHHNNIAKLCRHLGYDEKQAAELVELYGGGGKGLVRPQKSVDP